ncbi:SANT/Myb-like DNA-binding domain-containing protein [Bradyrhizobium sp. Pha-3]|uniref:SANT/Myb-like DNA-binding domain-containing protein n=1 Tax=Bradyrhizobium sp. Pha-3 TaxID=208375 RepID=UPI0035D4D1C5
MARQVGHSIASCEAKIADIRADAQLRGKREIIMTTKKHKPWTTRQTQILLTAVREARSGMVRVRVPWEKVAEEVGHSVSSCKDKFANMRKRDSIQLIRKLCGRDRDPAPVEPIEIAAPTAPEPARAPAPSAYIDFNRPASPFRFGFDADIRARVAEQGATAGLLGDPKPGRSALDAMRRGEVSEPGVPRNGYRLARITLAGGVR